VGDRGAVSAARLGVFANHVYEYRKGVRGMVLFTADADDLPMIEARLEALGIDRFVQRVGDRKANIAFGKPALVAVARRLMAEPLNRLSPERDFMLGSLLGYDAETRCRRYLERVDDSRVEDVVPLLCRTG